MYSVLDYSAMARDGVRMDAYARAIAKLVTPTSVVADIGAGTGVLSLLAARAGARRVHAIETNPAVHLLADIARENGLADRIQIHNESSFDVELPERVDLIVSDLRGAFPLHGAHTELLRDARERLLRPNGILLPERDRFLVAAFESHELVHRLDQATLAFERVGLRATAARTSVVNSAHRDSALVPIAASDLLTAACEWGQIAYATWSGDVIEGNVGLIAERGGTAHGLTIWFEATLHDGIVYSNAPGTLMAYARTILPFAKPISLARGDRLEIVLRVDARGERWAWDTKVGDALHDRQTTFLGMPASASGLLRASGAFQPARSGAGDRAAAVLTAMDGATSVERIVDATRGSFPSRTRRELTDEVRDLVTRYAR